MRSREEKNRAGIAELEEKRNRSRKVIRSLKQQMDETVRKAAAADELDRKIYGLDYAAMRDQMDAEMLHFEDLSRMIRQLQSAELTDRRAAALEDIVSVSRKIDLDALIESEDYVAVRRGMLEEEDERYRAVFEAGNTARKEREEDAEFSRAVARIRVENRLREGAAETPEKAAETNPESA